MKSKKRFRTSLSDVISSPFFRLAFRAVTLFSFWIFSGFFLPVTSANTENRLAEINLPKGFQIQIYAHAPNVRAMDLGNEGTLFAGSFREGKVYAIQDIDGDQRADRVTVIDEDLYLPVGVDFYEGDLYVSAVDRILRYRNIENHLEKPPEPEIISQALPSIRHHGWKFIKFGPDGKLYVPVGAPCNVCLREEKIFSAIHRMNPDGTGLELFASGVRNTVGFDWHPETGELWFTDNGRDWLGDDRPPDELNRVSAPGMHFGFPYCHGESISDPEFGHLHSCNEFIPPVQELGPHVAALGMRFYTGTMFPAEYRNQIFIAEHGSWNRSTPIGYRVMLVRLNENFKAVSYEPFASGWLRDGEAWGRPVDVLEMPDGALLVSDDHAGVIYRVSYQKE